MQQSEQRVRAMDGSGSHLILNLIALWTVEIVVDIYLS